MQITTLSTPCVEWDGARDQNGYGIARDGDRTVRVHRAVYEATYGPLDPEAVVMHRCDNPPCYRIDHLQAGSHGENHADMIAKGRWSKRVTVTHCPAGHPYDEANTRWYKGRRNCRACARPAARRARAEAKTRQEGTG